MNLTQPQRAALEAEHTPAAVEARIGATGRRWYLRDFVYGAIDGCVTTFAIVSGVVGAELSVRVIVILGFVNLLADGFSMAVSNYLATKAERQIVERARSIEENHIEEIPRGEKDEIREIFRQKGFPADLLEQVVEVVTGDRELWIETMLKEEWRLSLNVPSPVKAALVTFAAFFLAGFIPLLPFTLFYSRTGYDLTRFAASATLTVLMFFAIGAMKSRFAAGHWFRSGMETLVMGGGAASVAYVVGVLLKGLA